MSVDHYENFPVASLLLPAYLREPVEAIYAFARSADDIADEGDLPVGERQAQLSAYHRELEAIGRHEPLVQEALAPIFQRLGSAVHAHGLPLPLLHDLLYAFEQDTRQTRYASFTELSDYCRLSANPVGRLLLHLYHAVTPDNLALSDQICTSLQLINFWQDVALDWRKNRVYLPQDDMAHFGVTEDGLEAQRCDVAWQSLMTFQVSRARAMMQAGAPLALALPGRIGWELRLIVLGGLRILECIESVGYDVFRLRPTLGRLDWPGLLWRALRYKQCYSVSPPI